MHCHLRTSPPRRRHCRRRPARRLTRPDRGAGRRLVCDGLRGKTLVVKGTAASDRLALRLRAGAPDKLEVDVGDNGSADFRIARDRVKRIRVKAGGGDDQVRIDDANGAFTTTIHAHRRAGRARTLRGGLGAERLNGDAGADVIDGNGGNDIANLGAGDDRFVWDPGDGSDTVEGRKGADTMTFNGSGAQRALRAVGQRHAHAARPRRRCHHDELRRHRARRRQLAGRQ